ncbi:MAG: type II and III secretion system protein family protein [Hyphomicrobiaceae bacterium]|nr:type II and III secretion system protein family protein [Hyphomicrobiaceae bacterium]
MRNTPLRALAAIFLALFSAFAVQAKEPKGAATAELNNSVLVIPANARFPMTKRISVGAGKSVMVQFPTPLKDVLVADPGRMDAVVQSTNQVFLIAKSPGTTNAFFFDNTGQQVLTLEVAIGADVSGLEVLLRKFLPGSNVVVETAGKALVLTGSVRTPIDSSRAADIAKEFAKSSGGNFADTGQTSTTVPGGNGSTTSINLSSSGSATTGNGVVEKNVINLLQVEGEEQVQLRVHVAEVSRSLLKQFGINIGAQINAGGIATSLLTQNALPLTAAAGLGLLPIPGVGTEGTPPGEVVTCATAGVLCNYNPGPTGSSAFGNSGTSGSFELGGGNRISQAMRALERDGLIRTLAEPNLTAISGEAAKFLAGGEFPIPIIDSTGSVSVTFKEFGVGVAFTPIVMSEGRISLKIETEVSELTTEGAVSISGFTIPALKKRQAKSTVELPSGGSIAMAGLISDRVRQNIDGFPGLKDLPVLGTLFRSRDFIKEETELVIIVTPYVIRPTARQNLALPTDGLAEASDLRAGLLGHFNRVYGKGGSQQPVGDLKGDYGFIVE